MRSVILQINECDDDDFTELWLMLQDTKNDQEANRNLMLMHVIELLSCRYNSDVVNASWTTSEFPFWHTYTRRSYNNVINAYMLQCSVLMLIRYDTVYLCALKSWQYDQPNPTHGTETK